MERLQKLFGWAIVLLWVHMTEQIMFGLDELYELQAVYAKFATLFTNADLAAVVMVTIITSVVFLFCYGLMIGGRAALAVFTYFGLEFTYELHHVFKTITHGEYFPGAVSSIAIATVGCLILKQVWAVRNLYGFQFSRRHLTEAA